MELRNDANTGIIGGYKKGKIIKNVKGVTVPNSGGQKGIATAAVLGVVGGDANKMLEVIADADDEARKRTRELVAAGMCEVELAEDVPNLYIKAEVWTNDHKAAVTIEEHHTDITEIEKDGETVFIAVKQVTEEEDRAEKGDRTKMTLRGILEYADTVDLSEVEEVLERQVRCNTAISQEGLDNPWGARVGKTMLENWTDDVKCTVCARAAAGSDARMSGCPLLVIINSGSGNQGITVTLPVVTYAERMHLSTAKMYRCLLVSNLVSIYIKHYIGSLSAFCGAVSAACGAGAAITYMAGGTYEQIGGTITNTLGKVGMKQTDKEILNVMIDKVDVDSCL